MADDRARRAWALFDRLADVPPEQREAALRAECAGDPTLRGEVERLLALDARLTAQERDRGFLQSPLVRPPSQASRTAEPTVAMGGPLPERIGRYRVVRLLGAGGMGTVYEAEQDNPRRAVALKVIRPGLTSPALAKRFANEAQILGRLHHPGVAQVYEAGVTDEGQPFFAMEFIQGRPLDEHARRRRLDVAARLDLAARVCDAVQHAHDRGVIHRDLKPANILVDESGQPKILDFGVARAADADRQATALRTQDGQLLGTPSYMSPEQVTGDPAALDVRSDVYALGVILFELLADRLPYHLANLPLPEVALAIRDEEPPRLGSINTALRGDVETIAAKALAKDRGRRYGSAGELAADIRRHLAGEPILARPPSALYHLGKLARRHKALVTGVLGVIVALVVGLIATAIFAARAAHNARVAQEEGRLARYQTYLARLAAAGGALQSHDVAEAAHQLDRAPEELRGWEWQHLHSRLDDSAAVLPVPADSLVFLLDGPEGPWVGTTAPDVRVTDADGRERLTFSLAPGQYASLVRARDEIWVADNDGPRALRLRDAAGRVRCLFEDSGCADPRGAAVSPDGARAAVIWHSSPWGDEGVALYDTATGKRTAICGAHQGGTWGLAFSRDGRRLATCGEDRRACVWDAATGALVAEMRGHTSKVHRAVFRPDGARLLTASADGTVRQWDTKTGREVEPPFERHAGEVLAVAYSPDGRLVASAGTDRTVRVWQAAGRQQVAVLHGHRGDVTGLAFSADGRRLASASQRVAHWHGDATVRFWDVGAGADLPVLRGHGSYVYPVAYSPDGRWIASGSWDKTARLWDATTGECCAVLRHPGAVTGLAFAPDSTWLVSACNDDDGLRVWDVLTAELRRTIRGPGRTLPGVAASPDSAHVAAFDAARVVGIYEVTTGRLVASGTGSVLSYSPDGRWLAGAGEDYHVACVWDALTFQPVAQFTGHTAAINSVAFSPDGRRLVSAAGGDDRTVRVWDISTGASRVLQGHTGEVFAAAFSPDGTRVVSAGRDRDVWLWDPDTGEQVARLVGHTNYVWSLAFSPDGKTLASGSGDGTVRLWDTEPLRVRHRACREAEALRPEAERLVQRLLRERTEPARVAQALKEDAALSEPLRRAAFRALLRPRAP